MSRIRKRNVAKVPNQENNINSNGLIFDVNLFKRPKEVSKCVYKLNKTYLELGI